MNGSIVNKNALASVHKKKWKRDEVIWSYLFIAPIVVGLLLFLAFPLIYAFIVSFTRSGTFVDNVVFLGFGNFSRVFRDREFWQTILNAFYSALGVPIGMAVSVAITTVIMRSKHGNIYKMIMFLPMVTGSVALSFMWRWMYNPLYGIINNMLTYVFGMKEPIDWLGNNLLAMPSMIFMGIWSGLGINIIMLYTALKNVGQSYYEAAQLDGANVWHQFCHITLPSITPTLFYMLVTGLIGALQDFSRFQVMMQAGASSSINMPVVLVYYYATNALETGYASTLGIILSIIIMIITAIQFVTSKYWVKYD